MCEIVVCDKVVRDKGVCERMVWIQVGSMLDACWIRILSVKFWFYIFALTIPWVW